MKSKKLISFLCAAALTASSFASLAITASAATEADILWSDTFDGRAVGMIANGNTAEVSNDTAVPGLTFYTTNRSSGDKGFYTNASGETVKAGSYYEIMADKEDSADQYVRLSFPVFGDFESKDKGRWAHVDFEQAYTATADQDVVMDFDLKMTDGVQGDAAGTVPVLRVGTFDATVNPHTATAVKIDKSTNNMGDDWVHTRIIVSNSTGAKLYINGEEVTDAANADVKSLATIGLYSPTGADNNGQASGDIIGNSTYDTDGTMNTKLYTTPIADIDNLIIYNEAAGVATGTSDAPGAQKGEGGSTPVPEATPEVISIAPVLAAPSDVTGLETYTFDNNATKKWSLGTAAQEVTEIDGLKINIGGRSSGGTVDTYAAVTDITQGKVLQLAGCQYATAGRGPVVSVNSSLPVSYSDGLNTVMTFAVRLSAAKGHEDEAEPRLFLLKDNTQGGDDGAGAYRNVAAVLTTVEGETIYRGDDSSSDVISAYITPDEWHVVTLVITPTGDSSATHRLYVDAYGSDEKAEPVVKCDYVATGNNATYMSDIPVLAVESKAAKVNGVDTSPSYGVAMIDELNVYQGTASEPRRLLPSLGEAPTPAPATPTPEPIPNVALTVDETAGTATLTSDIDADVLLIQAEYTTGDALNSVKKFETVSLTAGTAKTVNLEELVQNDKILVWNNAKSMVPLASWTVTGGAAQETDAPIPTVAPTVAPTDEPSDATPAPTDEPGDATPAPTDEPGDATPAPTDEPGDATPAPTDEPGDATPAPTDEPVDTYTVTGTVDAGVATVTLTEKLAEDAGEDAVAKTYTGTIEDTAVTFTEVPAGTYTVSATANGGYINLAINNNEIEVTADTENAFAVTTTAITVPELSGAVLAENDFSTSDTWGFTTGRTAPTVEDGKLVLTRGNNASSGTMTSDVKTLDDDIVNSNDTEIIFDYQSQIQGTKNRWSTFSVTDSDDNIIISLGAMPYGSNGIAYAIGQRVTFTSNVLDAGAIKVADAWADGATPDALRVYLHVVSGDEGSTVSGYIFTVPAEGDPVWVATIPETAVTAANVGKLVAQEGYSLAPQAIDNVKITTNDEDYVVPNTVTVTAPDAADGTLAVSRTTARANDTVTVTATAAAGKKVTGVSVTTDDGTVDVTAGETAGTYTFTMPDPAVDVTVAATYARADVTSVEISGDANVAIADGSATYTATVKAGETVVDGTVTWSIAAKDEATTIAEGTTISDGVLTIDSAQTAGTIVITASTKKDVANDDDTEVVTATKEVSLVAEAVYSVTKGTETNGSFTVSAVQATAGDTITVVPSPNAGYEVDEVSYTVDGSKTVVEVNEGAYTFTGLTGNAEVNVTFKAINYTITDATEDENNSVAIQIDGADAITATIGQTVTIVPTVAQGYKVTSVAVKDASDNDVTVTDNTFVMPASNVTVTVTFEKFNGIYYQEDFESYADATAMKAAGWTSPNYDDGLTLETSSTNYVKMNDGSNTGREAYIALPAAAQVTGSYKISFDAAITRGNYSDNTRTQSAIGLGTTSVANQNYIYADNYIVTFVADNFGIGSNMTVSGITENNTFTMSDDAWYHYEIIVDTDAGTATVSITSKDDNTSLFTGTANINIADGKSPALGRIQLVGGRAYGTVSMDNILVTTTWYTGE